jgi:hypothetical protein
MSKRPRAPKDYKEQLCKDIDRLQFNFRGEQFLSFYHELDRVLALTLTDIALEDHREPMDEFSMITFEYTFLDVWDALSSLRLFGGTEVEYKKVSGHTRSMRNYLRTNELLKNE